MPIYEYKCEHCGQTLEELQKFSDAPLTVCPRCGGHLDKLMSLNSFHLEGTGWYVTDYKGKNPSNGPECPHGHEKTEMAKPGEAKADAPACPGKTEGHPACDTCGGAKTA